MGLRGRKSAAQLSAKKIRRSRAKRPPWERKSYSRPERIIAFIESLPVTSGLFAGTKLKVRGWQRGIIEKIYTEDNTGIRTVKTAIVSLPRKNGKTQLAAALALCHLVGPEAEPRGQVFSAAADREQAALVFREMEAMILAVPELDERCSVKTFHKEIFDSVTGSTYKALTADARKAHGLSPSFVVCDEMAQWSSRDLYDNLVTGVGARKEPLVVTIGTQSADNNHILSELIDYGIKSTDGTLPEDPTFHLSLFSAPMDADPWDEQTWFDCNPALDDFRSLEEMRIFAEQARKIPAKESVFRNLYLNQRVDASGRWISTADFDGCVGELPNLMGRECYAGLDLSSTQDLSALSLCFSPDKPGEPYVVQAYAWCPQESIKSRAKNDRVPYDLWKKQKFIEATPGSVIDYAFILKRLEKIAKIYNLKAVLFDRWGATKIIKDMEDLGFTIIEFGQGFASMSPPSKEMEKLIIEKKILFPDNPALRWCFSNVIAETDAAGNVKPSKKRSKEKIDMVVATIMALDGALRNQKKEVNPSINWL